MFTLHLSMNVAYYVLFLPNLVFDTVILIKNNLLTARFRWLRRRKVAVSRYVDLPWPQMGVGKITSLLSTDFCSGESFFIITLSLPNLT